MLLSSKMEAAIRKAVKAPGGGHSWWTTSTVQALLREIDRLRNGGVAKAKARPKGKRAA